MTTIDVSVVIPCFNADATLRRCLESVARQEPHPREILLVDDGSDRPIANWFKNLREGIDVPVFLLTQSNSGAPAARNAGLKVARSRYVAFLDADDIWLPKKLQIQHAIMEQYQLTLSGHGYAFDASQVATPLIANSPSLRPVHRFRFAYGNPFFTPTVMVRRDEFSGFDERFHRVDDYKAWLENFRSGRYMMIDAILAAGFKPPIGHSGLTSSIDGMHTSFIEVLHALRVEQRISLLFYWVARVIESIKLPIRRYRAQLAKAKQ